MLTLNQKITFALESLLVTHFLRGKPRGLLRALFRAPIFFHRIGLGVLAGKNILVLVTTGRKTGIARLTALGYGKTLPETNKQCGFGKPCACPFRSYKPCARATRREKPCTCPYRNGRYCSRSLRRGKLCSCPNRSGKPCGSVCSPTSFSYSVLTGWGGRSDWYLNALANPNVEIWVGKEKFKAIALPNSLDATVDVLKQTATLNPLALQMWESYTGIRADGSQESYLKLAEKMPSMNLVVKKEIPSKTRRGMTA